MKKFKLAVAVFMTALTIITAGICASNLTAEAAETVVLKSGSTGAQVRTLQTKLKNWGYYRGTIDGIYGSETKAAVIKFQKKNGLTADGIVGAKTAAALGMKLSASSSTNSGYASSDVYLLAKLVYGEARGEPYTGQVAVAGL